MNETLLTSIDYVIIASMLVSALVGLIRGLIRELLALLSWIVSIWLALQYADDVSVYLDVYLQSPQIQYMVAVAGIFVLSLLSLSLVALILTKLLAAVGIAGTDRSLGALFGILRGAAIVLVAIFVLRLTPAATQPWYVNSSLVPYFEPIYTYLDEQDFMKPVKSLPNSLNAETLNLLQEN
jgi:membrane protein required for colicin V production